MPFSNPIVGGTALVRPAINSPNFVHNSAGWSINQDGSAEFNNAVIRGELDIGGTTPSTPRVYITPNLPVPLTTYDFSALFPGTGPFKAIYAIVWYIGTAGDSYQYMALVRNNPTTGAGIVMGSVTGTTMVEVGPGVPEAQVLPFGTAAAMYGGAGAFGSGAAFAAAWDFQDTIVRINTGAHAIPGLNDFRVDNVSQGRGTVLFVASTANVSTAVGATILADPSGVTYRNGRVFKATFGGVFASTSSGSNALVELDTGTPTLISGQSRLGPIQLAAAQDEHKWITYFANRSGADVSTAMRIKMTPSAGTLTAVHAATYPFTLQIEDVGDTTTFTGLPTL